MIKHKYISILEVEAYSKADSPPQIKLLEVWSKIFLSS